MRHQVAIVHDYLTQRGGAERVVLAMVRAFPEAPLYTSLYDPTETFDEFRRIDVRCLPIDRIGFLRANHRAAFPILAPAFARLTVSADVVLCSSSGWAHMVTARGLKAVYCYTPARWLYQTKRYLGGRGVRTVLWPALRVLRAWDLKAALSAHLYMTTSRAVKERILTTYGRDSVLIPPPVTVKASGLRQKPGSIEPGFFLCVSRLMAYKNIEAVVQAFATMPNQRLVIVGAGPGRDRIEQLAGPNVQLVGTVSEAELSWLYSECVGLVAAAHEDFGLTPLEAAAYSKPTVALRWGGFLDTVVEGTTGVFFDEPTPARVAEAVVRCSRTAFDPKTIAQHASRFSEAAFVARLRDELGHLVASHPARPV